MWEAGAEDNQRNCAVEADRSAKEARRLERERLRLAELEEQAANWNRSQLLTAYLSARRAAAQDQNGASKPSRAVDDWLLWAEAHAASVNPLPA